MNYHQAATKILGNLANDDRFVDVAHPDYFDFAAVKDKATLSTGELVLLGFAEAMWTQRGGPITDLGKLDSEHKARCLEVFAEFYGALPS